MKTVVYVGNFGHWPDVADEFSLSDAVKVAGIAPAYEGEDVSALQVHPSFPGDFFIAKSMDELFRTTNPDVAVISTRLDRIADAVVRAAEAGCDVICEKPMGLSREELERVHAAVCRSNVRILPMLSMRTEPVFIKARELYRSGAIGEAALINTRKSYCFGDRPGWFGSRRQYGGTFPWVGIHAADMIAFICDLKFCSVSARQANFAHMDWPECEDICIANFQMSNHALATMSLDILRPSAAPTHGDHWIRVVGIKGVLEASVSTGSVQLINEEGESLIQVSPSNDPFYFSIVTGVPAVDMAEGFHLTEAMICARDSADQNGAMVPIRSAREYGRGDWL